MSLLGNKGMFGNPNNNNLLSTLQKQNNLFEKINNDNQNYFLNNNKQSLGLLNNINNNTNIINNNNSSNNLLNVNHTGNSQNNINNNQNSFFVSQINNNNNFGGFFDNLNNNINNNQIGFFCNNSNNNTNNKFSNNLFNNNNNFSINNNGKNFQDSTIGNNFTGYEVIERNCNSKFFSINALPCYEHASFEELRLADFEKRKTGNINIFKIRNTSNSENSNNNTRIKNGVFDKIKNNNNNGGLFENSSIVKNKINNQGILFANNQKNYGFFEKNNQNNKQRDLFGNNENNQSTFLFENNKNNNNINNNNPFLNNNYFSFFDKNNNSNENFSFGEAILSNNNQIGISLLNDNNNDTNNKPEISFFNGIKSNNTYPNIQLPLFGKKNNSNSLFENNNTNNINISLLDNNQNNQSNNKPVTENIFINNNLLTENNNNQNNTNNSLLEKINNNKGNFCVNNENKLLSFGNLNQKKQNNLNNTSSFFDNLNNNNSNNNSNQNNLVSSDTCTLNQILSNPLTYFEVQTLTNPPPKNLPISKNEIEAIEKQKTVNEFLKNLNKKYKNMYIQNTELNENLNINEVLLNKLYSNEEKEKNYKKFNDNGITSKLNNSFSYQNNDIVCYNMQNSLDSSPMSICDEFEKLKKENYTINNNNNSFLNLNIQTNKNNLSSISFLNRKMNNLSLNKKISGTNILNKTHYNVFYTNNPLTNKYYNAQKNNNEDNNFIGRNEYLYEKNINDINKLNNSISIDLSEKKIFQKYFKNNDNDNNEDEIDNSSSVSSKHLVSLSINYRLPEYNNIFKMKFDNVNQLIKVEKLKIAVKNRLEKELILQEYFTKYTIEKITLMRQGEFMDDKKILLDYNLRKCNYHINALIIYYSNNNKKQKTQKENLKNSCINISINENSLVPYDKIPKLSKKEYKCYPDLIKLCRMTIKELKNVKYFRIYNKFGEVSFNEPVDLYGINLDNEIIIEQNLIDTGDKLDYDAEYKLFDFKADSDALNKYINILKKSGGINIRYDNERAELSWDYKRKSKN